MNLQEATQSYIVIKRSLGMKFNAEARILRFFVRTIGDVPLLKIEREACQVFCRSEGFPTTWWSRKHYTLRGFFAFCVARRYLATAPLPKLIPHIPRAFVPYIYSRDELHRLLDATKIVESCRSPLQVLVFRTLVLTLYAAGLRPGEGLRLRLCDVDLNDGLLAVWSTKFHKSRLVPIGSDLAEVLNEYRKVRLHAPMPAETRSAFFATRTGKAISLNRLEEVFIRLRMHACISRPESDRWQPRLHDLRHTFAVHRLIAWYQEDADVQAYLPILATYLGHANISGTQTYLTMTSALLAEASNRFERYAAVSEKEAHHA